MPGPRASIELGAKWSYGHCFHVAWNEFFLDVSRERMLRNAGWITQDNVSIYLENQVLFHYLPGIRMDLSGGTDANLSER